MQCYRLSLERARRICRGSSAESGAEGAIDTAGATVACAAPFADNGRTGAAGILSMGLGRCRPSIADAICSRT